MNHSNLYYFANYYPDTKARHVQMAKMVDSFMKLPVDVNFVLRDYRKKFKPEPKDYYNLENNFKITQLPSLKFLPISYDLYFHRVLRKKVRELVDTVGDNKTFFYSRYGKNSGCITEILIESADMKGFRGVFAEVHEGLNPREKEYVKRLDGIVVISNALRNMLVELGIDRRKIHVAPSCADLETYELLSSKGRSELREKLALPKDKNLIVYTGHLYEDRGIEILTESARFLDDNTEIVIVGGLPADVKRVRGLVNNLGLNSRVRLMGNLPASLIPHYQLSSDVLVMPYSESWKLKQWSSPMKMFEYMASKRPIVASDFPIVREVLNEKNSHLVRPGSPTDLAEGFNKCLADKQYSGSISTKAFEDVKEYTWDRRAKGIMEFMHSI